jgi:type I restriction enzyme S subunit
MSANWNLVKLSEIARPVWRPVAVDAGVSYRTIGVRLWGQGAYERETIDGSQTAAKTLFIVHENDLIINKIWVRNGSIAVATKVVDGCAASGEFPTFELDQTKVLPRWLHWLSKTKLFWEQCDKLSQGTSGKNRIKPELFLTVSIPLPPLEEQRRIISKIDKINAKINESRLHQADSEKDLDKILLFYYSEIIKGAKYLPFGEVAPLVRRPVEVLSDVDYLELGVRSFGKGTFHKPALNGLSVGSKKLFQIEPNDLIFNIVFAWEGAIAVVKPEDGGRVGSHRFLTCVPKEGLATSQFLRFHFLTPKGLEDINKVSPGSAGRNKTLGIKSLENIKVPVPEFGKQLWFDELQAKTEAVKQLQTETAAELDALLPAVLDRAFKGEL